MAYETSNLLSIKLRVGSIADIECPQGTIYYDCLPFISTGNSRSRIQISNKYNNQAHSGKEGRHGFVKRE